MKIAVIGLGYVGASLAAVLSYKNEVNGFDLNPIRRRQVEKGDFSFLGDSQAALLKEKLNKESNIAVFDTLHKAVEGVEAVFVCVPTDYHETLSRLDTSAVEEVVKETVAANPCANIIVKSTVPIGFCDGLQALYPNTPIMFIPEFLRENQAVKDTLCPSRFIVGFSHDFEDRVQSVLAIYDGVIDLEKIPFGEMSLSEAEAVKLFSNTYLALRVAYFNELDTFALSKGMNAKKVIRGVSLDPRIGDFYNNPSFGYGGYCLPKDSKQLFSSYEGIPEELVKATIASNELRKDFIRKKVEERLERQSNPLLGIFRLVGKRDSNSIRDSASLSLLSLKGKYEIQIYEPNIEEEEYRGIKVNNDLNDFLSSSTLIVANRDDPCLESVKEKVFTRDLFHQG